MAILTTQIQLRRDTAANLANVVLDTGEPGYATDTKKLAIGDGSTKFSSLKDYGFSPTVPDPTDYYWANVKVSTSSSTSTKPTFANNFLVNIATNNVLTPSADWATASAIPKYLWHDLLPFRAAKAEYSTNGSTWIEDTTDEYKRTLTNQKENQTITVLSNSRPYARFTWDAGSAIWHACQADWLVIGFAYASPSATCSIKFQYSTDGTTWTDSLTVGSGSYGAAPSWFKINNGFSSCRAVRLVLTRTNSSGTLNLSSVKWLTKRWGNQGMGSELEKPYSWDNNANLYYRNASSTLGLPDAPWQAIYGTTIYQNGTKLDSLYAKLNHAGTTSTYGLGTTTNYGHVKINNGDVSTVAHSDGVVAGMNHTHSEYALASDIPSISNCVTYTKNTNVTVAGATKNTYTYDPTAIFAPNGLIMGGTAASAGLVTRGICGVMTPNEETGACTKDNLYLNYDGNNTWNPSSRGVVINAGSTGENLGNNMYSYCAVRGDVVKAWVEAKGYITSASIPEVNNGTLTIQRNGTTVATFTANQAGNTTANITDNDTKNTAGSTNSESKLYLIGAASQAANPQTYSDAEVYTQAGELNATSVCVAEHGQIRYDETNECIRFVIA